MEPIGTGAPLFECISPKEEPYGGQKAELSGKLIQSQTQGGSSETICITSA